MEDMTTIQISKVVKAKLKEMKIHPNQSYNELINKKIINQFPEQERDVIPKPKE